MEIAEEVNTNQGFDQMVLVEGFDLKFDYLKIDNYSIEEAIRDCMSALSFMHYEIRDEGYVTFFLTYPLSLFGIRELRTYQKMVNAALEKEDVSWKFAYYLRFHLVQEYRLPDTGLDEPYSE